MNKLGYEVFDTEDLSQLVKYKDHRRLKVFYEKGVVCVKCGVTATHIEHGKASDGAIHVDVFAGSIPMTIDHIIPKVLGGTNHMDNLQPMCRHCNTRKGCSLE